MSAYIFVAVGGGSLGLLVGGLLTQTDQLALDLLHQHPDRGRSRSARTRAARGERGHRPRQGRRRARLDPRHGRADARHLRDRDDARLRLGLGAHARLRRRARSSCWSCSSSLAGAHREPDHAAAHPARSTASRARASCAACSPAGLFSTFFLGALYLERVRGYSALAHRRRVPAAVARGRRALGGHHRPPAWAASARAA